MKIIKNGNKKMAKILEELPVKFLCKKCGCEWIAIRGEYTNASNQHDGEMYSCVCPCCRTDTWAYETLVK